MIIGRNQDCPCRSGKKYKKCCLNNVVSMESVVGKELDLLQNELFSYFEMKETDKIIPLLEELAGEDEMDDDDRNMLTTLMLKWIIFHKTFKSGTLAQQYIDAKRKQKKPRPSVMKQLEKWHDIAPSFSIITKVIDEDWVEVIDLVSEDRKTVKLFDDFSNAEEGMLLFGFLLPYGSYYSYFLFALEFDEDEKDMLTDEVRDAFDHSNYEDFPKFMIAEYPNIINNILFEVDSIDLDQIEWLNPLYEEVAEIYQAEINAYEYSFTELASTGILMWNIYTRKSEPIIRKPEVYAAALHYIMDMNVPGLGFHTQKELAERYKVSTTALSRAYRKLENGLSDEFQKMHEMSEEDRYKTEDQIGVPFNPMGMEREMLELTKAIENQEFETDEDFDQFVDQFLNKPSLEGPRKLKAQDLIYEAYEVSGKKRIKLASQALELDSNCIDAYNILGEEARTAEEALIYFEKGMVIGRKELGDAFFKENAGDFWGLIETRPYMRARYNFACTLIILGQDDEAINHFERLLILNENDNLGIRDELFPIYLHKQKYDQAQKLLKKYAEDYSVFSAYNNLLVEFLLKGKTPRLNKLYKVARRVNPHVVDYLTGKKKMPQRIQGHYQLGSEEEAELYMEGMGFYWQEDVLLEWLKEQ